MDCREFLHSYSEYDDSLVPAHEADRFRAHMAECPSCARYDRVLRKGRMLARQLPPPEPSPDFILRLERRLLRIRSGKATPFRSARLAAGLAAATVLMVAASAVHLMEAPAGADAEGAVAVARMEAPAPPPDPARRVVPHLPAAGSGVTRAWTVRMVATADTSSYSPLVTGPPGYRARFPSSPGTTDSYRRLLD